MEESPEIKDVGLGINELSSVPSKLECKPVWNHSTIKNDISPGICSIIEGNQPCMEKTFKHGLCSRHYIILSRAPNPRDWRGLKAESPKKQPLHRHPQQKKTSRLKNLSVKPQPDNIFCRLTINGRPCDKRAHIRGLCTSHYQYCLKHEVLELFGTVRYRLRFELEVQENPIPGRCQVISNGQTCSKPELVRGLCRSHYDYCRRNNLVDQVGLHKNYIPNMEVIVNPVAGMCRISEDGTPCDQASSSRGLCKHHYYIIRKSENHRIDDYAQTVRIRNTTRPKSSASTRTQNRKLSRMTSTGAEPIQHSDIEYMVNKNSFNDQCRVIEVHTNPKSVQACEITARKRGLCNRHYNRLRELGLLQKFSTGKKGKRPINLK